MTTITALPTPPSRQDPTNFNDRADAFLAALPAFATEANAVASETNTASANAVAANQAVIAATNITKWVSGTTYTNGAVVWSPINGLAYRRITASGSGTTDPSADSTNYALVNGTGNVDTTSTQTLSNKTLNNPIISGGYTEAYFSASAVTNYTINLSNGSIQSISITGSVTYTFPTPVAGKSFTLIHYNPSSSYVVTWPANVRWPSNSAPVLSPTFKDIFSFVSDGTYWYGAPAAYGYTA